MGNKNRTWIGAGIGILVLILDSKTCLSAAKEGVDLCIQTLIPSLFPFFVFSSYLTGSIQGQQPRIFSFFEKIFRIPSRTGGLMLVSFLGGYPAGAQCIRQAYDRGSISQKDALRMLWFCNNPGPSFLFGIISVFFPKRKYIWALWTIHILSALTVARLIPPSDSNTTTNPLPSGSFTLTDALERSIRTMASVCGWVIIFRMILSFLDRWILWIFPDTLHVLFKGLTELTNGCLNLNRLSNLPARFLAVSAMTSFGGVCILLQIRSVIRDLPFRTTLIGKLLQTGFCLIYAVNYLILSGDMSLSASFPALILLGFPLLGILCSMGSKFVVAFRHNMVYNRYEIQK